MKTNEVIIGSDYNCILLSIYSGLPLILKDFQPYFAYDRSELADYISPNADIISLIDKSIFFLKISGMLFMPDSVNQDNNFFEIREDYYKFKLDCKNVYDFRNSNNGDTYEVVDYFKIKRGGKIAIEEEINNSSFINKILFVDPPFDEHKKSLGIKDACVISYLTEKELKKEEFSEIYVFLYMKKFLKEIKNTSHYPLIDFYKRFTRTKTKIFSGINNISTRLKTEKHTFKKNEQFLNSFRKFIRYEQSN